MNNIEQYKKRFYNLMESTMGDAKPLISENQDKYFKAASELLNMMSGLNIVYNDRSIVQKFRDTVKTPEDLQNLIRAFGKPQEQDLMQWLEDDLGGTDWDNIGIWINHINQKQSVQKGTENDTGKFDDYAIKEFKQKGFTRVSDTEYKHAGKGLVAKYKYFPENGISGFTLFKNGTQMFSKPADACWSELQKY
jgi:hypothetical protein